MPLPWHRFKKAAGQEKPREPQAAQTPKPMSPPPSTLAPAELAGISDQLGDSAYGKITLARKGLGPTHGLSPEQLVQMDRYLEGSTYRDADPLSKGLRFGLGAAYEGGKALAMNAPGGVGVPVWNATVGRLADFDIDPSTAPPSLDALRAYGLGMFSKKRR